MSHYSDIFNASNYPHLTNHIDGAIGARLDALLSNKLRAYLNIHLLPPFFGVPIGGT